MRIDAVVTDVDGGTVAGRPVTVTAGRLEWVFAGGSWVEQVADEQTCTFTSTGDATDGVDAVRVHDRGRRHVPDHRHRHRRHRATPTAPS